MVGEARRNMVLKTAPHLTFSFSYQEKDLPVGVTHSDSSFSDTELDRSITLHFKISCPASPAFNYSRNPVFMVPQVKIEMESDYDFTDMDKYRRETDSETTL
ncbi:hypothetical protein H8959_013435 [Pygathrix nigripes]